MPKPKKKVKKLGRAIKFFSAVGGGVFKAGSGVTGATRRIGGAITRREAPERADEVARRLQELKRLEALREEERKEERKLMEERVWEERVELKRPLSERLSEVFYVPLKRPAQRMAKFFKGMDEDLYKANIRIAPERYIALVIGASLIAGIFGFVLLALFLSPLLGVICGVFTFLLALMFGKTHPRRRAKARVVGVNQVLPYALRHMSTQLSSGIGLPETMTSVSRAGYGALSEEFERVIHDMHAGMSMEEALVAMNRRVDSEPLRRATRQIQRTLRTGGDLARILNTLADETAFEMRMKLRGYTQSLNLLTMVYMFASAVIPALLIVTMVVAAGMAGAPPFTTETAGVLFLLLIPFMLFYFVIIIKRFEPRL